MKIKPIASSSKGTAYAIESGGKVLLIEAGVPLKKIREVVPNLSEVVGCLISHEHGDHAGYAKQLEDCTNVEIWATPGTKERYELDSSIILPCCDSIEYGNIRVLNVPLSHDCECYGFLIRSDDKSLFYASDTSEVNYTIPGLTHLMIEANHSLEQMLESTRHNSALKRAYETHLSIDSAIEFIKRHPQLEEIWLIHLSSDHADAQEFKRMVQDVAGCIVKVAGVDN